MAVNVRYTGIKTDYWHQDLTISQRPKDNNKNKINQTLSRLYPLIKGPHKKN